MKTSAAAAATAVAMEKATVATTIKKFASLQASWSDLVWTLFVRLQMILITVHTIAY